MITKILSEYPLIHFIWLTRHLNEFFQAADILNDDFGESEDNLSIRTLSERESSPVSFAVSPVGSVHETDTECSFEDGLLTGSPHLNSPAR